MFQNLKVEDVQNEAHRNFSKSTSQKSIYGVRPKVKWDKTVFRITRIPATIDRGQLRAVLGEILEQDSQNFRIHSLASDASDATDPQCRVATVSFHTRPTLLQAPEDKADDQCQWDFELPQSSGSHTKEVRIYFDTHMNGFTPLSPIEDEERHTIEYGA